MDLKTTLTNFDSIQSQISSLTTKLNNKDLEIEIFKKSEEESNTIRLSLEDTISS